MKKINRIIALLITVVIAAGLTACKKGADISEVRVAYFPNITHAQALVMKDMGTLEEKLGDITVKWVSFNAGPSEIEAMFAGEVDIGYIGPVPAVSGYVQSDGDLRIIAGASNGGAVLVARSDVQITSAKDLDGKKVAIPQFGNTQHLSLLSLLKANDLSPTTSGGTVEVVPVANADVAGLMEQKEIDAALVPEPWGSILELQHGAKVVLDYDKIDPNGIPSTAVVIVRKDFMDEHKDIVEKFMEAHKDATVYINANNVGDMINKQISEITQSLIDEDIMESALKRMEITYEIPKNSIMDFAEISADEDFIPKLPAEDVIDDSFVK